MWSPTLLEYIDLVEPIVLFSLLLTFEDVFSKMELILH